MIALVLVASASLFTVGAANKKDKNKDKKGAEGEYIFAKSSITHHDFLEETG